MSEYQKRKNAARQKAIEWQADFENHNYSYGELAAWNSYFEKLGKRYGLTEEFRENGIIAVKFRYVDHMYIRNGSLYVEC